MTVVLTVAFALTGAAGAPSATRLPQPETRLPAWLAPGAPLSISGVAEPGTPVALTDDRSVIASAIADDDGHFSLRGKFNKTGVHRLSISSEEGDVALGPLLIRPVRLAAVGDVTFGGRVATAIAGRGTAHPWLATGRVLRGADLTTANLEGAVSNRGRPVPDKEFHFRGPPAALSAARRVAGLDVVSVANNHTLDFGTLAFLDTLRIARRNGIHTVGGGIDVTSARRPVIFTRGGLRIAFLGYSDVRPEGFTAAVSVAGTAPADPAGIRADVGTARRRADVVVVWFHWGGELARRPDPRQSALAAAALNARAHLVLGSHAHILQHVLRPSRRTLVAWSLGNFVFPPYSPGTDRTGILLVDFGADGVRAHRLLPARIVGVQPRLVR